ncbi:hypothetical protein [Methylobacterium sp. SyP6R]|uniref:hypothetical protein n=1 Tax=Methylobacterium sp. SyP6R TaxID=2718876 RepID=UPI001F185C1E|nr:hypothetical protein [Methylobacterium sp. SyP6R]MCF4125972.1 hypothetical protein [Methylobacterium sp. SyP6R]
MFGIEIINVKDGGEMQMDKFKNEVHEVYRRAISSSGMWMSFSDTKEYIFRGVSVYGFDGGYDFAKTNINEICSEIMKAAKARQPETSFQPQRFGDAALDGMMKALSDLTKMKVERNGSAVVVIWAENVTNLI